MSTREPTPTSDQIRAKIDSGQTGDKVDWNDPAAAPLGADAEAAGASPGSGERKLAAAEDGPNTPQHHDRSPLVFGAVAVCLLLVFAAIMLSA